MGFKKTLFMKPRHPEIAEQISIKTPKEFRESIRRLSRSGGELTLTEKRALVLARTRAKVQLKRKNLSPEERRQMKEIARTKIPPIG